jgi:DNA transposition AAA+ family ATPase
MTLSARQYAGVDAWQQWQRALGTDSSAVPGPVPSRVLDVRSAIWTPTVTATAKEVDQALPRPPADLLRRRLPRARSRRPVRTTQSLASGLTELLIVDEADRLKTTGLEQVRDYYDRHHMGVILIGMPGIERRLAYYPQLYSRIGFAHEYRPLNPDELTVMLTRRWHTDSLAAGSPDDEGFTPTVAIATIARIAGGNSRLVDRLLTQIQRIRQINNLDVITPEVIEAAREALLIGS